MVIKKKEIIKLTAEKLGLPVELVDDLVSGYYKEFQRQVSSMKHAKIRVVGLGQFYIVKKRLLNRIYKTKRILDFMESKESTSIARYETRLLKRQEIENMQNMYDSIVEQQKAKGEFKRKHRG